MIELTKPLQEDLDSQPDGPLQLMDPRTKQTYFLVRADVYERLSARLDDLDDGLNMQQVAVLMEEAMGEDDAEDPLLESYQKYRNAT
jgi:hypothetical protein